MKARMPTDAEVVGIRAIVMAWGKKNFRRFPWRRPQRKWHGLAAEILLQRTRAKNVIPVYEALVRRFREPSDLAAADVKEIHELVRPLGLAWRVPLLKQLGIALSGRRSLPKTLGELLNLPGVGAYAASAWLSFHGGVRAVIIDVNVVRFLCRLTGKRFDGETRREKWVRDLAGRFTPKTDFRTYNYAVLDFTMSICTPQKPDCLNCPIGTEFCRYGSTTLKSASKC